MNSLVVVRKDVLPPVILKVLEVKRLLARGEEKSSAAACKRIGISRSAYYKYKDSVFTYDEKDARRIVSVSAVLKDEPGVLSGFISAIHALGGNILTVNQNIPIDGAASVTVTMRLRADAEADEIPIELMKDKSVIKVKVYAGDN